jgi:DNA-binding response OmpR family regulator
MMGRIDNQMQLLILDLDSMIPENHLLRQIKNSVNFDFIYAQIKNLRKKLKDAGALAELKAVYGFGYKMTVE